MYEHRLVILIANTDEFVFPSTTRNLRKLKELSMYTIIYVGVAVATAFCALESSAVTSPSEWPFQVTTGNHWYTHKLSNLFYYVFHLWSGSYQVLSTVADVKQISFGHLIVLH